MNRDQFAGSMQVMKNHYSKFYPGNVLAQIYSRLEHIDFRALESAIDKTMLSSMRFIPEPAVLIEEALQFNRKYEKENRNDAYKPHDKEKEDKQMVERSSLLIRRIIGGELTPRQAIESCQKMDRVYPGYGWGETAANMIARYEKAGADMDKLPDGFIGVEV